MKSKIFAVATFAFAAAFAFTAAAATTALPMGGVTVKAGSNPTYVMGLQSNLNNCAMANPVLVADGKYGPKTTAAVAAFQVANGGLTVDGQAGPLTQAALVAKCAGSTTPTTPGSTTLSGGAGDATITSTSTDVESSVKEDESDVNVLGFQVEADGSDINVSNVKVIFQNDGYATSSEKLTNYVDSVSVFMGSTEVGSADASDFSRDSDTPDTFTKTIALSNAVVKDNKKVKFYVAVSAVSTIDSDDITNGDWNVLLDTVRYNDATGAILSDSSALDENFTFDDQSTDDDLSIKSSSANPLAATLMVEEDSTSDNYLVGAFKLDVDDQSSDITLNEIPVVLTINDSANTASSDDNTAIIDEVTIKVGGTEYSSDSDSEAITNGDGTATYIFNIDGEETIDAGEDAEVKIYVKFNDQDTNYGTGTTVVASVTGANIDAEGSDELASTGSFTGKTHTLSVNAPTFSLVSKSLALYQAIDGVGAGEEDVFLAKFVFNVTAGDEDVYLSQGVEGDANYTDYVSFTQTGSGTIDSQILEADDESIDDGLTSSFLISSGDTEKFTLSFFVRGDDAAEKFTIDGFSYGTADDAATAYVYASDVTSGLSTFSTNTVFLAK